VLAKLTENFLLENLTKKSKFTNFDATTNYCWSIGVARGREQKAMPPQIFKKHSHFVLSEAFFQTK